MCPTFPQLIHLVPLCTCFFRCICVLATFACTIPCAGCLVMVSLAVSILVQRAIRSSICGHTCWDNTLSISIRSTLFPVVATLITNIEFQSTSSILSAGIANLLNARLASLTSLKCVLQLSPSICNLKALPRIMPADCAPTPVATSLHAFQRYNTLCSA